MLKTVAAGITALAIAGGSMVYAQQRGDSHGFTRHWRPSAEDVSAFTDARIAALRAGLKLTADQDKNWPNLEKALRDNAKMRSERFAAHASADRPKDPVERLRLRADAMTQRGTSLKQIADAATPLYQSLDDSQKQRFAMLAHFGMRDGGRHHGWRGHGMMHGRDNGPGADEGRTRQ